MRSTLETIHYSSTPITSDSVGQRHYPVQPLNRRRLSLSNTTAQNKRAAIRKLSFKRHDHLSFVHYSLWRIHAGYIRTLTHNAEGDFVPLGFWSTGDVVGYPVAQVSPYIAECLTVVEAECLSVNHPLSREMVLNQIKQSTSLLRIAHCRDSRQRILQFVCWLAERFGKPCASGIQIHLKLTHQEIAESVGTTRVTVTRLLKTLERANQIVWTTHEKIVFTKTFEQCCL